MIEDPALTVRYAFGRRALRWHSRQWGLPYDDGLAQGAVHDAYVETRFETPELEIKKAIWRRAKQAVRRLYIEAYYDRDSRTIPNREPNYPTESQLPWGTKYAHALGVCLNGHPLCGNNVYRHGNSSEVFCRTCGKRQQAKYYAKNRERIRARRKLRTARH